MKEKKDISIILLLAGRYEQQICQFDHKLKELHQLAEFAEIIVVGDSPCWTAAPAFQMFQMDNPEIKVAMCDSESIPARALNLGLAKVETEYVMISLLGDPLTSRFNNFQKEIKKRNKSKFKTVCDTNEYGYYICPALDALAHDIYKPSKENLYGWAMTSEIGFSFGSFCVPVSWLLKVGGFDENPILLEEIERWYALLVTSLYDLICVDTEAKYVKRLKEYVDDTLGMNVPRDLAIRYATYCRGAAAKPRNHEQCKIEFANDLNDDEFSYYAKLNSMSSDNRKPDAKRYKILIVGGVWEYHHNQICFFNYLERMYGKGYATFRSVFEYYLSVSQVLSYDVVIFVRCRSENALNVMRACQECKIATLYMIDDNWMSIAKDHPDMGKIFVTGNPNYDNFIEALGLCKATWLFNDLLREDILPYTKCVKKFKISVDQRLFEVEKPRIRTDDTLYIGFSGSLRYDDSAFRALARYARRNGNVVVILVGILSDEQEALFKNVKTIRVPFSSYKNYARKISMLAPDLLIAPLEDTHTMRSKCYNKYVESGIVGSACVYSHCQPYTDVICNGVNGYFVEDETQDGWYNTLQKILSDIPKLRDVQKNIKEDIYKNHTVDCILDEFCAKLSNIIEEENLSDD